MPIDPRIPLGVQQYSHANTLMDVAQVQGARKRNELTDFTLATAKANAPIEAEMAQLALGEARANQGVNAATRDTQIDLQRLKSTVLGAERLRGFVEQGDLKGALADLESRKATLDARGTDSSDTQRAIASVQEAISTGDLTKVKAGLDQARQVGMQYGLIQPTGSGTPAPVQTFNAMTEGLSPEDRERARRVQLGLDSREGQARIMDVNGVPTRVVAGADGTELVPLSDLQRTAQAAATISNARQAGEEAATTAAIPEQVTAKTKTERFATQIDDGFAAADSLPVIKRALDLLGTVKTGGINAAALAASNLLGVTGADEAELSNNLGKAVLSQLRSTFGAAFTEREGARLDNIEANFGKSTEGNVRLLQQLERIVEREALRGINAARMMDDPDTEKMIREAMSFSLSPDPQPVQGGDTAPQPGATEAPQGGGWKIRQVQ